MSKQSSSVNRPDAADILELPPGVHKVEWTPDLRFPLCGTFTLYLEDYTVGYILRNDLLRDKRVKFVGLRQPHPLTPSIELRIQAIDASPLQLFLESLRRQRTAVTLLGALFKAAVDAHASAASHSEPRSSSSSFHQNNSNSNITEFGLSHSATQKADNSLPVHSGGGGGERTSGQLGDIYNTSFSSFT